MRRVLLCAALAAWAATGCRWLGEPAAVAPPPLKLPPPPPVRAEAVTPANAHDMARQLNDELDRATEGEDR
jgi:hypothetical protein